MATTTPNLSLRKPDPADNVNVATDINDNMDRLDAPTYSAAAATTEVVKAQVDGDAHDRWHLRADGRLAWGPGNVDQDIELYRNSAGVLRTSGGLIIDTDLTVLDDLVVVGDLSVTGALSLPIGSIETADLADDAVNAAKILAGAVGTSELADNAVTSKKLDMQAQRIVDNVQYSISNTSFSATSGGVAELELENITYRGGILVVSISAELNPDADGDAMVVSFQIRQQADSVEAISASDDRALRVATTQVFAGSFVYPATTGLIDGTVYKVRLMHRVTTGGGALDNRNILVYEVS